MVTNADVVVSIQIETAPSVFLELDDPTNGYEVGANSFTSRQVTHRQVKGGQVPWVEGGTINAGVRDLVVEPMEIYVDGVDSHFTFETRLNTLTAALEQLAFRVLRLIGDAKLELACVQSDYTISSDQPLIIATQALVQVQLVHQPAATLTQVV